LTRTAETYVGKERLERWHPIKEFVDAGVIVSFGSDWPAGTPDADPWRGLEAMITRMDPKGDEPGKVGEPVDLATGIEILTLGDAKTMMQEAVVGSIEKGKYADMIILDRNLFDIDVERISDVKVLSTLFEGREVYRATTQ
jgi:predicted amidohydrolase YtcJ